MFVVVFSVSFALMPASVGTEERFIVVDRFVPHVSTVPANAGEKVGIYLHEKLSESVASQIEVGTVWVNTWYLRDLRTPFGGTKLSGIGREGGRYSLDFYSEPSNICIKL